MRKGRLVLGVRAGRVMMLVFLEVAGMAVVSPCFGTPPQAPLFQGLGPRPQVYPYEVAGDGSKVVYGFGPAGYWSWDGGWSDFGFTGFAYGASGDGSVIIGWKGATGSPHIPFRWTEETGVQSLPSPAIEGMAVSSDGSTIVGSGGTSGFLYTAEEGVVDLSTIPGMPTGEARGVSGNGMTLTGRGEGNWGSRWVWTRGEAVVVVANSLEDSISPWALSADGRTVVGSVCVNGQNGAGFWRVGEPVTLAVPRTPGGDTSARDVTRDGSVLTGYYYPDGNQHAWIWDEANGVRSVEQMLTDEMGLDVSGWRLRWAYISDDGRTLAGAGVNPQNQEEAWIAVIPEPAALALLACGGLMVLRRRGRRASLARSNLPQPSRASIRDRCR